MAVCGNKYNGYVVLNEVSSGCLQFPPILDHTAGGSGTGDYLLNTPLMYMTDSAGQTSWLG